MKRTFDVNDSIEKIRKNNSDYFHTFINLQSLAMGVLVLQPGEEDTQTPHESDEMYYIVKGDGSLRIGNKDHQVKEGLAFFVEKQVEHYFHSNTKELVVLYFFGGPDV